MALDWTWHGCGSLLTKFTMPFSFFYRVVLLSRWAGIATVSSDWWTDLQLTQDMDGLLMIMSSHSFWFFVILYGWHKHIWLSTRFLFIAKIDKIAKLGWRVILGITWCLNLRYSAWNYFLGCLWLCLKPAEFALNENPLESTMYSTTSLSFPEASHTNPTFFPFHFAPSKPQKYPIFVMGIAVSGFRESWTYTTERLREVI